MIAMCCVSPSAWAEGAPTGNSAEQEDQVRVQGTWTQPTRESVAATVVEGRAMQAPGLTASDVLRTVPGALLFDTGGFGQPSTAALRGASAAQTPVYFGGLRLNDDVAGAADLSLVPLWMVERIEVYRGHAPLAADRLTMGGAIFFEPRRPRAPELAVGTMAGSFRAHGVWVRGGTGDGRRSLLTGVRVEGARNDYPYADDQGLQLAPIAPVPRVRENADARTVDGWLVAHHGLGSTERAGSARLVLNFLEREAGVPGIAVLPALDARQWQRRALFGVDVTAPLTAPRDRGPGASPIAPWQLETHVGGLLSELHLRDERRQLPLVAPQTSQWGARAEGSLALRHAQGPWEAHPIVNVAHELLRRADAFDAPPEARRLFLRAGASVTWADALARSGMFARQDALRVRALLAGECHGTATGALSDPCGVPAVTGRADVELGLGPVRPFAAVGRYVRVPTLGELYGVTDVVRGNGALAPETAVAVDGGLKAAGTVSGAASLRWGAEANVFARYSDDLIQYVRASQGYLAPQNVESARVVGLEATARASAFQRLFGDVVVTLLDPRNTSPSRTTANDLLPLRSPVVVVSSLRFDWPVGRGATETLGPSRGLQRVGAVARVTYLSSRFADPAGLAVLAEQAWLDLEASVALFGTLDVRARVGNVTDALRTDIVGYPLPGRTFFLSLESHL